MYKHFILRATVVLLACSFSMATQTETAYASENTKGETVMEHELTMDEFLYMFQLEAIKRGLYDLAANASLSPDVLYEFTCLDEWRVFLDEVQFPLIEELVRQSGLDTDEMNLHGYFPRHDVTIVNFNESGFIKVYFEMDSVDLRGRYATPIRHINHDHVLIPLEPLFEALGINYSWNYNKNILRIYDMSQAITLQPGRVGFGVSAFSPDPWELYDVSDTPVLLQHKSTGLYVHTLLFRAMFRVGVPLEFAGELIEHTYQPFHPLIYHDKNKVVIVSNDRIHYPNYRHKLFSMSAQFARADFPLESYVSVAIVQGTNFHEITEINFESVMPFIESTILYDYVMLPAYEIFTRLGMEMNFDVYGRTYVTVKDRRYVVHESEAIFPQDEVDWAFYFVHEVVPVQTDDTLFISHTDLKRMLHGSGIGIFLDRNLARLYIHFWMDDEPGILSGDTIAAFDGTTRFISEFGIVPGTISFCIKEI